MSAVKDIGKDIFDGFFGGANAAENASQAQVQGVSDGIAALRGESDIAQRTLSAAQARQDAAYAKAEPYRQTGLVALDMQKGLLGLSGIDAQQSALLKMQKSPSQKFLRERAERSLVRNSSAIGGLGGGNVRTALQEQAVGMAGQQLSETQNRLASLAGMGFGAMPVSSNIAQASAGLSGQLGSQIMNASQNIGQFQGQGLLGAQAANAELSQQLMSAIVGGAAGGGAMGPGAASAFGGSAGSGALVGLISDANMKENINDLSQKDCFELVRNMKLKSWQYLHSAGLDRDVHFGPMAQDAPQCIKISGKEMLNLHDEIMLIAGALQYATSQGLITSKGEVTDNE